MLKLLHRMYNNHSSSDHNKPLGAAPPVMSPRISFSNDFVESSNGGAAAHHHYQQLIKNYRDAPVSSDFEFCVSNYSAMTMSADELFSKGRLLPYKETGGAAAPNHHKTTTLKDELLVEDDDVSLKPPKSPTRWKGLLGLRKSHIGSKKVEKNSEDKRDEVLATKNSSRDALHGSGGSSSCRDMEFRFN